MKGSNISDSTSAIAVMKDAAASIMVEGKSGGGVAVDAGSSTLVESDEPVDNAMSAPTHLSLDHVAEQVQARGPTLSVPQELLASAVAKYKRSIQHWSFQVDSKSPPFPPPPPQSSPVGFPVCQVVVPRLLHNGDSVRHVDAGKVQILSDDAEIIIQ